MKTTTAQSSTSQPTLLSRFIRSRQCSIKGCTSVDTLPKTYRDLSPVCQKHRDKIFEVQGEEMTVLCTGCNSHVPINQMNVSVSGVCLSCAFEGAGHLLVRDGWRGLHDKIGPEVLSTLPGKYIPAGVKFGLELEVQIPRGPSEVEAINLLSIPPVVNAGTDGSIKQNDKLVGYELRLPPASGQAGEKLITDTTRALIGAGATVDGSCGMHVHYDAQGFDAKNTASLLEIYLAFEDVILSVLPQTRRSNRYCKRMSYWLAPAKVAEIRQGLSIRPSTRRAVYTYAQLTRVQRLQGLQTQPNDFLTAPATYRARTKLEADKNKGLMAQLERLWYRASKEDIAHYKTRGNHGHDTRYFGFNLHSLFSQGHYELRYHSGTVNPAKIIHWVTLHAFLNLKARANVAPPWDELHGALNGEERVRILCNFAGVSPATTTYFVRRYKLFSEETAEQDYKTGGLTSK